MKSVCRNVREVKDIADVFILLFLGEDLDYLYVVLK